MAATSASMPVSKPTVNGPRRRSSRSVAMKPGRIVETTIRLPRTSERMPSASALRARLARPVGVARALHAADRGDRRDDDEVPGALGAEELHRRLAGGVRAE